MKNTLTKITLMSQLIPKLGTLNKKQSDYIRNISETAIDMDRLVQNMLALAKIDAGGLELKREPVKINDLVSRIAEEFQVQAKAREQELQFEQPAEAELDIEGDLFQLEQALRNLVSNALKYTPEKGSIVLCVQASPESVTINVKDNGYGIPRTELPFIFDRFYRVDNDQLKISKATGWGCPSSNPSWNNTEGECEWKANSGKVPASASRCR